MVRAYRVVFVVLVVFVLAATASAQGWRGQGRVAGKVTDESGKPLEGVVVKLLLPTADGGTETNTNSKGEWAVAGITSGAWQLDFVKPGYETRRIAVPLQELTRIPAIETVMKKAVDPNAEIKDALVKAAELVNQKKFTEAREIYESILAKYPQARQVEPYIARSYYAEGQYDKAIEHLRSALADDPENVEVKMLLGSVLLERGDADEGQKVMATIDESRVKDPLIFLNVGIGLLNKNKAKEALPYFEKTVTRFPTFPDGYYYRGLTMVQIGMMIRPDSQAEGDKQIQAGKADLQKFVQMAPDAPEAAVAKTLLEQLK
jgi:tetratricopeptide (TPR) repeat protein